MSSYSIRKNALYAFIGGGLSGVLILARNYYLAGQLPMEQFAQWNVIQLFLLYAAYAHLGINTSVANLAFEARARDDLQSALRLQATTTLTYSGLIIAAVGILAVLPEALLGTTVARYRYLVIGLFIVQHLFAHAIAGRRAEGQFARIALGQAALAGINLLLLFFLDIKSDFALVVWAMIVSYLLAIAMTLAPAHMRIKRALISRATLKQLLSVGIPLAGISLIAVGVQNIDRLVIANLMDFRSLAVYGFAVTYCAPIYLFPRLLYGVLMSHFSRSNAVDSHDTRQRQLLQVILVLAIFLSLMAATMNALADWLVGLFFPDYHQALPLMTVLLIGSYLFACASLITNFGMTQGRQLRALYWQGLFLTAMATGLALAAWRAFTLEDIARLVAILFGLYLLLSLAFQVKWRIIPARNALALFAAVLLPAAILAILAQTAIAVTATQGMPGIQQIILRLLVLLAPAAPLVLLVYKRWLK